MPKRSAGLLMYRERDGTLEVLLVHPGGPFWAHKDKGAWTLPKGEPEQDEDLLATAQREFHEETGFIAREPFLELGSIRQASGKVVSAWAFAGDCDPAGLRSNTCRVEWPPRSRRMIEVPEVDRAEWFPIAAAQERILATQQPLLERLVSLLEASRKPS